MTSDADFNDSDAFAACGKGKIGSFQMFVENQGPIENYSPSIIPTQEVHKIAILDLRLLNLDRNECNILV